MCLSIAAGLAPIILMASPCLADEAAPSDSLAATGLARSVPHLLWTMPFAILLLAIAILPLVPHADHWWERFRSKLLLGLALGGVVLVHYGLRDYGYHGQEPGVATVLVVLEHALLRDYVPFIVLLFSLYVISGGLQLKGHLHASPSINTALLALGAGWPA